MQDGQWILRGMKSRSCRGLVVETKGNLMAGHEDLLSVVMTMMQRGFLDDKIEVLTHIRRRG